MNPSFKSFALIGAAGYIAPRHMKAIAETGNDLVAAMDKSDSVGILDRYFPKAAFFTEFERFDRHLYKLKSNTQPIDFLSVCTPNHLHDAHIRYGLRLGADVICEKPLVLNSWNLDNLESLEKESGKRIYNILQLRHHPTLVTLKEKIQNSDQIHNVDLTYITSRGKWYYASWKGDQNKSGGVATNIGIHFFDLLNWLFGKNNHSEVHIHTHDRAAGYLEFEKAKVKWFVSINDTTLPQEIRVTGGTSFRSLDIDGEEIDLSYNFEKLHTESYKAILNGKGFSIEECRPSIKIASQIRKENPIGKNNNSHRWVDLPITNHPFKL